MPRDWPKTVNSFFRLSLNARENDRPFVVDCTVGLADAETLQGIANLGERLRSTVVRCDAVVVTSEKADVRKRDAVNLGVIVVEYAARETPLVIKDLYGD